MSSLLMFALYASDALGIFISVVFTDDNSDRRDIEQLVRLEAVLIIAAHLLIVIFVR